MVGFGFRSRLGRKWDADRLKCGHYCIWLVREAKGYTITFNRFIKIGFPFMIVSTAIASMVLTIGILISV
jgi:hypothetical protein